MSFTILCGIAIKWAEEGKNGNKQRACAFSCDLYANVEASDVVESRAVTVHFYSD